MSTKTVLAAAAALAFVSCSSKVAPKYPQDTFKADDGTEITLTYYAHASIGIEAMGKHIYVDPVGESIDWEGEPKADLVLVTHQHGDHLDTNVVKILTGNADGYTKMAVGTVIEPFDKVTVEAVPAYNISPDQLAFHPKERGDAGYIITVAGKRIYVSGDTEDNEDVLALKDIDIAFVCCNKPYTMTVEQCVNVVKAIRPEVFIPYHYGGTGTPTDLDALQEALKDVTTVLIRPLM